MWQLGEICSIGITTTCREFGLTGVLSGDTPSGESKAFPRVLSKWADLSVVSVEKSCQPRCPPGACMTCTPLHISYIQHRSDLRCKFFFLDLYPFSACSLSCSSSRGIIFLQPWSCWCLYIFFVFCNTGEIFLHLFRLFSYSASMFSWFVSIFSLFFEL